MTGQIQQIFEQYSQSADMRGFFGPSDVDNQFTGGRLASVNSYLGHRLAATTASGGDGTTQYQYLDVFTNLRINPAVSFRGHYHLGEFLRGRNSGYRIGTRPGTRVAASDGQWTMWWVTGQLPIGTVAFGKRPKAFGMGLASSGDGGDTSTETLLLLTHFGPLRVGGGLYLSRRADLVYWNPDDKNNMRQNNFETFVTYRRGNLDIGFEADIEYTHQGGEGQLAPGGTKTIVASDRVSATYDAYVKYYDGRFFFNAEAVYDDHCIRRLQNTNVPDAMDGRGSRFSTDYIESLRYAAEFGVAAGPGMLSFLYAYLPGADRRNGVLIHKQAFLHKTGYNVFIPYSYLLGYAYGAGVGAFDLNGYGFLNDAVVKAVRVDYAVAANLNLYATFLKADRAGHGYGWGFIDLDDRETIPDPTGANVGGVPLQISNPNFGQVLLRNLDEVSGRRINAFDITAPNIPDTDLGWEFTVGMDWEILSGSRVNLRYAYWVPGKWFSYACVDKSVANRGAPNWGVNPDRLISGVMAWSLTLLQSF
ncbi:MAG: hypothetical protein RDU20_17105 [Desulfomonilaceae bacterium]|nr:hypothetical protein [Desulfomonilaceae bacterium]